MNYLSISISVSYTKLMRTQSKIDTETDREFISNFVNSLDKPSPISNDQSRNLFPNERNKRSARWNETYAKSNGVMK